VKKINKNNWHEFIRLGYRLFFGSGAACLQKLIGKFLQVAESYNNLEITHILTLGETPWTEARYAEHLRVNAFFWGGGRVKQCSEVMPIIHRVFYRTPPPLNG
jgi:hypothetical protein